jgi:hypothetical protein
LPEGYNPGIAHEINRELKAAVRDSDGLPNDTVLWRGTDYEKLYNLTEADIGKVINDEALVSTSSHKSYALTFTKGKHPVLVRILTPEGTKAIPSNGGFIDWHPEFEYLFDGAQFKLRKASTVTIGKKTLKFIEVEMVGSFEGGSQWIPRRTIR